MERVPDAQRLEHRVNVLRRIETLTGQDSQAPRKTELGDVVTFEMRSIADLVKCLVAFTGVRSEPIAADHAAMLRLIAGDQIRCCNGGRLLSGGANNGMTKQEASCA